jgi:hypothetical protein
MRNAGLLILFVGLFAVTGFAQTYKVGDEVELYCNCNGPTAWVKAKVELVQGNEEYRVRYGGKYDYYDRVKPDRLRRPGAGAESAKQNEMRERFRNEASVYRESVQSLMYVHDPNLRISGSGYRLPPTSGAEWTKVMSELTALDNLCKTKYQGLTNENRADKTNLDNLPATWCEIAAKRNEYKANGLALSAKGRYAPQLRVLMSEVEEALNGGYNGYIDEDIQLLTYEREKWRAKEAPKYQKGFADLGVAMPADFFKEIEAKADEFKAANERIAPTRSFLMPKHKDATIEAFIRGRYATEKKGVQILKIGLDDASWVIHRNSLGVPTSQTRVARLLVKVPNRPFCQEHSVAAERNYKGGSYGALSVDGGKVGAEGAFMRCE